MITAKLKELNYDLLNANDYETYFIDECITLVRILSECAWKSISKHTKMLFLWPVLVMVK